MQRVHRQQRLHGSQLWLLVVVNSAALAKVQVVRASPDVQADDGPEMHDGQAIGVHRAFGLLRYEVIHHAQETCG